MTDAGYIADSIQFALILEVCSEKTGNVTPTHDFADTRFEDYLRGAIALKPTLEKAASGERSLGDLVLEVVTAVKRSHTGGNTHLGLAMLLTPLAKAAGECLTEGDTELQSLQDRVKKVMESSTVDDALKLYEAINLADTGGLEEEVELDVRKRESLDEIKDKGLTLLDIMKYSAGWDSVASELANGMENVFKCSKAMRDTHEKTEDLMSTIVQTYLTMLADKQDTLIVKKVGLEKAEEVSAKSREVLDAGGVLTVEGREKVVELDSFLRNQGNKLNPGTTADLVTASLAIALLHKLI